MSPRLHTGDPRPPRQLFGVREAGRGLAPAGRTSGPGPSSAARPPGTVVGPPGFVACAVCGSNKLIRIGDTFLCRALGGSAALSFAASALSPSSSWLQSDVTPNYEELGEPSSQPPALPCSLTCALAAKRYPRSAPQVSGRAVSAWRGPGAAPTVFPGLRRAAGSGGTARPLYCLVSSFPPRPRVSNGGHACPTDAERHAAPEAADLSRDARRPLCPFPTPGSAPLQQHPACSARRREGGQFAAPPAVSARLLLVFAACSPFPAVTAPRWFPRRLNRKAHTGQVYRVLGAAPFPGAASAGEVSAPLLSADHEDTGPAAHAAQRLSGRSSLLHQLPGPSGSFLSGEGPCDPSSQDKETGSPGPA